MDIAQHTLGLRNAHAYYKTCLEIVLHCEKESFPYSVTIIDNVLVGLLVPNEGPSTFASKSEECR